MSPTARLAELGLSLPPAPKPVAAYIPSVRSGDLVFVSGQLPFRDGELLATGSVPDAMSLEDAQACARQCALNAMAVGAAEAGGLDNIKRVVRVGCFVACPAGYGDQPKVANGASELLASVFGEAGRHARAAVGCSSLPLNAPVEVEVIFEVA